MYVHLALNTSSLSRQPMETLYIKKATDLNLVYYYFWNENMILYQETRELWSGAGFVLLNPMFSSNFQWKNK